MDPSPEFDREAAERVLRRAITLSESGRSDARPGGVSEHALVEAAEELGVDARIVLQAASEERLGLLRERTGRADRLVGPATITASRLLAGTPADLLERLDGWLRHAGSLRRQRLGTHGADYRRRSDVVAGVQRTVRSLSGQEDLGRVSRLSVTVRPVDEQRSVVALSVDLGTERTMALLGGSGVAGLGSATSALLSLNLEQLWPWLGVPVSAAAGVGIMAGRAAGLPDVQVALEGVLDRMAAGEQPVGMLTDVRRRLMGSATAKLRAAPPASSASSRRAEGSR